LKTLGKGSFGTVKLVKDTKKNEIFAMKIMSKKFLKKKRMGKDRNAYDVALEELNVLKQLEHPNIIFVKEIIHDAKQDKLCVISEYHKNGTLYDKLE